MLKGDLPFPKHKQRRSGLWAGSGEEVGKRLGGREGGETEVRM